jgi:tetratricopeptide (TPR) repeat protein
MLGITLMTCGLSFCFLDAPASALEDKVLSAAHSVRGRIFLSASSRNVPIAVRLSKTSGNPPARQDRTLGYDGAFSFEGVTAGDYLLTIESQDLPTIARAVELKGSLTPKTLFLTVRLAADGSATIQEVVKDAGSKPSEGEDISSSVSKKAFKAFQKAAEESSRENSADAIEYLKKAIAEEPNYFEAYNNLGAQYQKLKRWDQAIEAFLKAVTLRDLSVKPHINLGNIYLSLGQPDSAIKHFQSALTFDANSLSAHLGLGQAFFQKRDYDSAGEHLETATRLDPRGTKRAFVLLIQIQVLTGRYDRARYFLNAMGEFFPNDPDVSKLSQMPDYPSDNPTATTQP